MDQALDLNTPPMVGEGISHTSIPFHSAHRGGGLAGYPAQAGSSPQERFLKLLRAALDVFLGSIRPEVQLHEGGHSLCHAQTLMMGT